MYVYAIPYVHVFQWTCMNEERALIAIAQISKAETFQGFIKWKFQNNAIYTQKNPTVKILEIDLGILACADDSF